MDRWATGDARGLTFEAAFAVRQTEIGLAGFLSLLSGLRLAVLGAAMVQSARYPRWLGLRGLLDSLGVIAAGAVQASTGFSGLSMTVSIAPSSVLLVWIVLAGILLWRGPPAGVIRPYCAPTVCLNGGSHHVRNRLTIRVALVTGGLVLAAQALAGPFDRPPRGYGTAINRNLDQAGFDLRLKPEGCRRGPTEACSFSSSTVAVVVNGQATPGRIGMITISTDLLRDAADADPGDLVADATAVLAATMATYDPELSSERREQFLSSLTQDALTRGQSAGDGFHARYELAFDQGADGLLVITVTPSPATPERP